LLFAPAAGYRNRETGELINVGTHCCYWASSSYASDSNAASTLFSHASGLVLLGDGHRSFARSVRCVQHLSKLLLVPIRTAPKQPGWAAFPALNLQSTEPPPTQ